MDRININFDSVQSILRKCQILLEEVQILVSDIDKDIVNAELEGWNDKRYFMFKDSFEDTKGLFNSGLKKIEEEHIPDLKKLIRISEEHN